MNRITQFLCVGTFVFLAQACASMERNQSSVDHMAIMDQDLEYVRELQARVKSGAITEAEKKLIWQAYLLRLQAIYSSRPRNELPFFGGF